MLTYRLVLPPEAGAAAELHRRAGALIPGYDTTRHTLGAYRDQYLKHIAGGDPVWGAFDGNALRGHCALLPGWIDHLYVDPIYHGNGIGTALVTIAQREQDELRLYTFQSNVPARRLYEKHGFVVEELTDGRRNEEKMPDVTYFWAKEESR